MKKGDKRIRVDVFKKEVVVVDGKEVVHKTHAGKKDIYETNRFSGSGAFNMSFEQRNRMPRADSLRQQRIRFEAWFKKKEYDSSMHWKEKNILFEKWMKKEVE
jgi:hypothetical protein